MKILTLALSNLNSLRQPVRLDFASGPLATAGLFAITGPTGAGKSTLLDAVTLALYNATARDQRSEIVSRGQREAYAEVEFEAHGHLYRSRWDIRIPKPRRRLSQADRRGRGKVSMTLARIAAPGDPAGQIVADYIKPGHERSVPDAVARVTSLDFTRFRQSMLLAQGEFDAFLTAGEGRRSDLLEQITGTAIYSEVSRGVFARHKRLRAALELRQAELERQGRPDPEETQRKRERETLLRDGSAAAAAELSRLRTLKTAYDRLRELDKSTAQLQSERERYERGAASRARDARRLEAHERATGVGESMRVESDTRQQLTAALDERSATQARLREREARRPAATTSLSVAQEAHAASQARLADVVKRVAELKRVAQLALRANAELVTAEAASSRATAAIEQLSREDAAAESTLGGLRRERDDLQAALARSAAYRNLGGILAPLTAAQRHWEARAREAEATQAALAEATAAHAEALAGAMALQTAPPPAPTEDPEATTDAARARAARARAQQAELTERLEWLHVFGARVKDYLETGRALQRRRAAAERLAAQLIELTAERERRTASLLTAQQTANNAHEEHRLAEEALATMRLHADLRTRHAHALADGQPCPLCGAREHPAGQASPEPPPALHGHERRLARAAEALATAKSELDSAKEAAQATSVLVAKAQGRSEESDLPREVARHEALTDALLAEYAEREGTPRQAVTDDFLDQLRSAYAAAKGRAKSLGEEADAWSVYAQARSAHEVALEAARREVERRAAKENTSSQRLAQLSGDLADARAALLTLLTTNALPTADQPRPGYATELRDLLSARATQRHALEQLDSRLRTLADQRTTRASRGAELRAERRGREARAAELRRELSTLTAETTALFAGAADADAMYREAEAAVAKTEEAVRAAEAASEQVDTQIHQLSARLAALTERSTALEAKLADASAQLSTALTRAGFATAAVATAALLNAEVRGELLERQRQASAEHTRLNTLAESLATERARVEGVLAKAPPASTVAQALASAEDEERERVGELGSLRTWLTRASADAEAYAKQEAAVAKLAGELVDWTTLNELVGSADGKKFRQFAQRLTLQQLLTYANAHLRQFYPRFSVSADPDLGSNSLAVYVRDRYEADQVRDVSTVSGGERFLVSLALALGFSHMASRRLRIDTLFIDEGFGALDGETLDRAIDALERLRQGGKTIGIISHVAALRERIATQVLVERTGSGGSRVTVEA